MLYNILTQNQTFFTKVVLSKKIKTEQNLVVMLCFVKFCLYLFLFQFRLAL